MANGVKIKHRDYDTYAIKWRRCRDVVSGQDAVHKGGTLYLPMLKEQELSDYLSYVARTPFYNATWRTIAAFVGMLFRKPVTIEVPKKIEPLLEDVTMSGISFQSLMQDCVVEDFEVSRVGILVDFPVQVIPEDGAIISIAKAEAQNLRPTMQQYKAEAIINWRWTFINNKNTLTQVRLLEEHVVDKNEFETEIELRIKVLDLFEGKYRMRVFKEDNEIQIGGDVYPLMNGKNLTEIPFFFIGPDGTDGRLDEPIMIDLVDLNLKHYQVSADYEHGCHMTGLPTPVISGYSNEFDEQGRPVKSKFYIGSATAWVFPDPNTTATYLEFTGQGLAALEKNLDRKEAQMAAIGARMLTADKAGVEAAETTAMRHSGEHSILAAVAIAVSSGGTKALKCFAEWAGASPAEVAKILFAINRDFMPYAITPQALTALLGAVQAGLMSHETFFDLIKRGDLVEAELTFDVEQARIDASPIEPPAPVAAPARPPAENQ